MHYIDARRGQIFLKHRPVQLCLRTGSRTEAEREDFRQLLDIVLTHLPEQQRVPPARRDGYRWWLGVALAAAILVLFSVTAAYYEKVSSRGEGGKWCDIGGHIHVAPEPSLASWTTQKVYVYEVYRASALHHRYCLLHGSVFATLHPGLHMRSVYRVTSEGGLKAMFPDPFAVVLVLLLPLYWWFLVGMIIIFAPRPLVLRFREL